LTFDRGDEEKRKLLPGSPGKQILFCQQTLTQFAFETKQLFGAETLQDTNAVLQDEVNKFWRKEVTTLPAELLEYLIGAGLSRAGILNVVREHLGGKHYMSNTSCLYPHLLQSDYCLAEGPDLH